MDKACYFPVKNCAFRSKDRANERFCRECRHSHPPEDLVADMDDNYGTDDKICRRCWIPKSVCNCKKKRR